MYKLLSENDRHFRGQWSLDRFLVNFLIKEGKINGKFLEVGAWDGLEWSNCSYLEKILDWKGLCVEPLPDKYKHCVINRWNPVVNKAVHIFDESIRGDNFKSKFIQVNGYAEALSGLQDLLSDTTKSRIHNENIQHGGSQTIIDVECITLNELLSLDNYDYLSLDVQGAELLILQNTKPELLPRFISFDTNGQNQILQIMENFGYNKLWKSDQADEYLFCKK